MSGFPVKVDHTTGEGAIMRKISYVALMAVLVLGLGSGPGTMAAPLHKPAANTLEVGTSSACAYHTIKDAIAAALPGDTIKIENTLFLEQPLVIDKDLTLAGSYPSAHPYACLTQTGLAWTTVRRTGTIPAPILHIDHANVTISWIIFEDNPAGSGIDIQSGTLELDNVILQGNSTTSYGGAVSAHDASLTMTDTQILDNSADFGGGLYLDSSSSASAYRSLIQSNDAATEGAGVYAKGASTFLAAEGTRIESNRTPWGCNEGGGIYAKDVDTEVVIDASTVMSNSALYRGGGLYVGSGASATVQNLSLIRGNATFGPTTGGGGGVHVNGAGSTLSIRSSYVVRNGSDPLGGGIYNEYGTVNLDSVLLVENDARERGGGLYNLGGTVRARNGASIGNQVHDYDGGGLFSIGENASLDIGGWWFIGNLSLAGDGGAIFAGHGNATIQSSYFGGNSSASEGSAIYLTGGCCPGAPEVEVLNCYVVDNLTTPAPLLGPPAGGSSLYAEYITTTLTHNTFAHLNPVASFGIHAGPESRILMANNILTNFYIGIRRVSSGTGSVIADHTLYYNNTYDYDLYGIVSANEVHGDPAFAGATNYHITSASAALDTGTDAGLATDFDGEFRPWGSGFDIGADEYPPRHRIYLPLIRGD
jgi:hypothetical protein